MPLYLVHGCLLESSFVISGLAEVGRDNSSFLAITVTRSDTLWEGDESAYTPWRPDDVLPQNPDIRLQYWKGPEGYLIRFKGRADYLIGPDAKTIHLYHDETDLSDLIRDILVGPILAQAFVILGAYALHGSSVARDGSAIAFIGTNGAGKSTLATSHVADGWELLTDGMFVAKIEDGQAWVQPGDPRIRVRPDAAGFLDNLPQLDGTGKPEEAKFRLAVGEESWGRFAQTPQPLKVAYFLQAADPDEGVSIELCKGADAIMTAMANTYGVNTYETQFLKPHLKYLEQFLKAVPLRRLRYGKRLENLAVMREALAADFAPLISS